MSPDTTPPQLSNLEIAVGTSFVATGDIIARFNEPIALGTGTLSLKDGNGTVIETFDAATSSRLSVDAETGIRIDPTENLVLGGSYSVAFSEDAVRDLAGNVVAAAASATFNYVDLAPDSIATRAKLVPAKWPMPGSVDFAGDADWYGVTLVAGHTYTLEATAQKGNTFNPALGLYDAAGKQLLSDDDSGVNGAALASYTPATTGTFYVEGKAGGAGTELGAFLLKVTDPSAPMLVPPAKATGIQPTGPIEIAFNEAIIPSGAFSLTDAAGTVVETFRNGESHIQLNGATMTLWPASPLSSGAEYKVQFPAGSLIDTDSTPGTAGEFAFTTDIAGDRLSTTRLPVGRTVSSTIDTSADSDWFEVNLLKDHTYDLRMQPEAGGTLQASPGLFDALGNPVKHSATLTPEMSWLTFKPAAEGSYFFAGSSASGTTGGYTAHVTDLTDTTGPHVAFFLPENGGSTGLLDTHVFVRFDEAVQRGTGTILLKDGEGNIVEKFDAAASNRLTISGAQLLVDPTEQFVGGKSYSLVLPEGSLTDLSGNPFADLVDYSFGARAALATPAAPTAGATTAIASASATATSLTQVSATLEAAVGPAARDLVVNLFSGAQATQVATVSDGGTTALFGTAVQGDKLLALLPAPAGSFADVTDGALRLHAELPTGEGLLMSGLDQAAATAATAFLQSVIDTTYAGASVPASTQALRPSLEAAVQAQHASLEALGATGTTVRYVDFIGSAAAAGRLVIDAGAGANELLMLKLDSAATAGAAVTVKGVENVVLAGKGTVHFAGDVDTRITNDAAAQTIVGGSASETMVSSGGDDTFTGGGGHDTFAFAGLGHYTVTDFDLASDRVAFNFSGIDSVANVAPFVTSVEQQDTGVTYHFGPAASITLVGVQASQLTGEHVAFHV